MIVCARVRVISGGLGVGWVVVLGWWVMLINWIEHVYTVSYQAQRYQLIHFCPIID